MTVNQFRVRRLAVIDLHGIAGSRIRLWLVRSEFVAVAVVGVLLGWLLLRTGQATGVALGIVLFGIAANYLVLAVWALILRPERLAEEFRAHDPDEDGRIAALGQQQVMVALGQWRLIVPFLFPVLALRRCERQV